MPPIRSVDSPERRGAAGNAEQRRHGDAGFGRGLTQKAEIDDEHEQRGNFESRFRQRGAEEVDVVHCAPPASSVFTAGSI